VAVFQRLEIETFVCFQWVAGISIHFGVSIRNGVFCIKFCGWEGLDRMPVVRRAAVGCDSICSYPVTSVWRGVEKWNGTKCGSWLASGAIGGLIGVPIGLGTSRDDPARARQLLGNRTAIGRRPYGMNSTVAIEYIRRRLV
jgi:hypothetical protein